MTVFTVFIDDNFHYLDKEYRTKLGDFATLESAIDACKEVVDEYLAGDYVEGMLADDLYARYTMFGDDPFITGPGVTGALFSAWNYAQARAAILCGQAVTAGEGQAPVPC